MSMHVEPLLLTGKVVRLEPLRKEHAEALFLAAQDSSIWLYMPYNPSLSMTALYSWLDDALEAQALGKEVPFVIVRLATGEVVGSTRYLTIESKDRGLEIGWTWLTPAVQRSPVNTECKYLLLRHAFETLGAIRVQFKTDSRNLTSQHAIERLGATQEGILRNHRILPDGYYRHSVYYSILDTEWATVKAKLEDKMLLVRSNLDQPTK